MSARPNLAVGAAPAYAAAQDEQWHLGHLRVDHVHLMTQGDPEIVVATLGSGVGAAHPALSDSIAPEPPQGARVAGNGVRGEVLVIAFVDRRQG